jgi:hypothetical protein
MYQNLFYAVKNRILDEIQLAFADHPAFSDKVRVYNKFPYTERVQFGVILRNTSASMLRLSPDNFMSDLFSLVRLSLQNTTLPGSTNNTGSGIEWVRENQGFITQYITEDVSSQLNSTQRQFKAANPILAGPGEIQYADSPAQAQVTVNGAPVMAESLDGKTQLVLLESAPLDGSSVLISYHIRRIVPAGIYTINFTQDADEVNRIPAQFTITPLYVINKEPFIERTTGSETNIGLLNQNVEPNSEELIFSYTNGTFIDFLTKGVDYSINYNTGVITFLHPLQPNYSILANYRYVPTGFNSGPFDFKIYQEKHDVLPGVIISIGRRAKKGEQQIIEVTQFREQQARIYGGHWEMTFELGVIAKDPIQMAEMTDQVVSFLWGTRKNILEFEGITLNSVEPTGETEEVHIETTGDLYYESSVSINVQTEWQNFVPYDIRVRLKNIELSADLRPVMKGPLVGFERLT